MNWIQRLDVIVLALMLAYIVAVAIRGSYRYRLARRVQGIGTESRSLRKLTTDLSIEVGSLKSIVSIAPYLGLAGTCVGILSAFGGIGMEKHAAEIMIKSKVALALFTTAAGILVAVPATCFYNYLRTRIDLLESEVARAAIDQGSRSSGVIRRLAIARRFSQLPAFALIAAPGLAILVAVHTPYFDPRRPTGFGIDLASARCEYGGDDRPIVLHITDAGKIFINTEQEDWNRLAGRLSEIYRGRVQRILYLIADDGVPFQSVADAIDVVQNTPVAVKMSSQDITLRLITPRAINARCGELVVTVAGQHSMR
jgi:biopolymer transport protein ExbB